MKRPELLAPAGSFDSLVAAIEAGCDAIYLSGKHYGARSFANNFDDEELVSAINYAHLYGVKIYVTVNTLIYEDEVDNFIKYISFLHHNNVDAVIIQDIGMFDLIRQLYPNLELHISTQMHIHNLEGCQLVYQMGAKRAVLARETPIELVKEIKEKCPIDLEIFVHGALCISYSGQCLMSSLIGGRSGNRGTCAQCCRQPYELYCDNDKLNVDNYLLSTKDLTTLEHIGELIDIGVDSFKIEGRMKRPEYVYYVVSLYRKAIDSYLKYHEIKITDEEIIELKKLFNRKFTKGFLFHEENNNFINSFRPNHLGIEIGKVIDTSNEGITIKLSDSLHVQDGIRIISQDDLGLNIQVMYVKHHKVDEAFKGDTVFIPYHDKVAIGSTILKTSDYLQLKEINKLISKHERKVNILMDLEIKIGSPLIMHVKDTNNNEVEVISNYLVEESLKVPMTYENIIKQLSKVGETIYNILEINITGDQNIFIPVKVLNDLRREALMLLDSKRLYHYNIKEESYHVNISDYPHQEIKTIYTNNKNIKGYDEIITDDDSITYRKKIARVNEHLKEEKGKLLVGELGSVFRYAKDNDVKTDFSLNVTNSYSVAFLHSLGVNCVTLSIEMNDYQIKRLITEYVKRYQKHPSLALIGKGYPEAMIMKYDPFNGKYDKQKIYYLQDKYHNKFRVIRKDNLTYIYHYEEINKDDYQRYYDMGINEIRENSIF